MLRQLAQRVVQSQEEERARLSRELHDGISQLLVSVKLVLETATNRLRLAPTEGAAVARNLRPALLDDLGLLAALQHLAREMQGGSRLQISGIQSGTPRELPDEQATALFRIAQEALTNVERHANARHVSVSLAFDADATRLAVATMASASTWLACRSIRSAASACATCASGLRRWAGSSALFPALAARTWWLPCH
ncbi:hypothetical protein Tamer19_69930 [Cupriavidus sp. TA19]|nr:hypothetical protein Tamer19_69930 [Cupriavidus sp. TA19]